MTELKPEGGWLGWRDGSGKPVFVRKPQAFAMGLSMAMGKGILGDVRKARGQTYVQAGESAGVHSSTWWEITNQKGRALSGPVAKAVLRYLFEEPEDG